MDLAVKVKITLAGDQLVVAVERLGSSVLRYDLIPSGNGFAARLRSRRVAPLHLPFEREFRDVLARIVERVAGGTDPGDEERALPSGAVTD
jgi:hypothetical protein